MENTLRTFRIQRRIGLAFTGAFAVLILLQLVRIVIIRFSPDYASTIFERADDEGYIEMLMSYIGSYVALGLVFLASSLHNRPFWRYFQVAVFILIGATLLLINPLGDLTGPMFMVTGIIVGYQYGLLRTHILTKLGAMVALATISRIASAFLLPDVGFMDVLFTLLAIILFAYVYYSLFREQIEEQRVREQAMRRQISRSEQYSQVGRNVGAILHNMKNVYFALNHGLEMLQHRSDEELKRVKVDRMELIASLRAATDSFSEKIENIVEYTGSSRRTQKERIYLRWHTARLIDIFSLDKEFKRHTTVQLEIPEDLQFEAPPVQLNQVLENLLMNSWEAIMAYRSAGRIRFTAREEEEHVVLRVEDDGGGIPGFEEAGLNGASLLHSNFFTIGRTTKPHGSGHGVAYIIETMRELGGDVVIYSSIGDGTATELFFPHPLSLEGEEESDSAAAPV